MYQFVERAIQSAIDARNQGNPRWAKPIAEAFVIGQLSALREDDLEEIVEELFEDCQSAETGNSLVADVLSSSPLIADRAVAAIYWRACAHPAPAVIADWGQPGSTWFTVYNDDSLLDSEGTPWSDWRDYVDAIYIPEHQPPGTVFLTPGTDYGRTLIPVLEYFFRERGYIIG